MERPTREQILSMEAGRELDELVHTCLFGIECCPCTKDDRGYSIHGYNSETGMCWSCGKRGARHYSTSIAAAWSVVEKLVAAGKYLALTYRFRVAEVGFMPVVDGMLRTVEPVRGDVAESICKAALIACLHPAP